MDQDLPVDHAARIKRLRTGDGASARGLLPETSAPLPLPLSSFIGRERELAEVQRLLGTTRLVTLTGCGGCGKTRLALDLAREVLGERNAEERLPSSPETFEAVCFVELAALTDAALVPQRVLAALGLREDPRRSLLETLVIFLQPRRILLVLDNCEHLIEACAALTQALLGVCGRLHILATSREPLAIAGETVWQVPPLSLPRVGDRDEREQRTGNREQTGTGPTQSSILGPQSSPESSEAVQLFVERARAGRGDFAVTEQNRAAVAQICRRLDGIPLALELAAARVKLLSPEQLAARLDDRFRLLVDGSRTALPRQQTLRATVAWSYALLSEAEQLLFSRLSVFAGGLTLEAAEAVCAGSGIDRADIVGLLARLVEKSLLVVDRRGAGTRFRLLETLSAYGSERLGAIGELVRTPQMHAAYYLSLVEEAEPRLSGAEQTLWLQRLEADLDNLRGALRWAVEQGEAEIGQRLGGALWRFWYMSSQFTEGRAWLTAVLALPGGAAPTLARSIALKGAGCMAHYQGDYAAARTLFDESLAIGRELDDPVCIGSTLNNLGVLLHLQGEYAVARAHLEESLAITRTLGRRIPEAMCLNNLGNIAHDEGDLLSARTLQEESLAIFRELDDTWGMAMVLCDLGDVLRSLGDVDEAQALCLESLGRSRDLHDRRGIAVALVSLGSLALARRDSIDARTALSESLEILRDLEDRSDIARALEVIAGLGMLETQPVRAVRLGAAAAALRAGIGAPLPPSRRAAHEEMLATARSALGDAVFAWAWAAGTAMPLDRAIDEALIEPQQRDDADLDAAPPAERAGTPSAITVAGTLGTPMIGQLARGGGGGRGEGVAGALGAPLVGRQRELAQLRAGLDRAMLGGGRLVLLAGEPGIGKTRLAEELSREARPRGALVLWGRCFETEGAPAFWPWVQLIRAYVRQAAPGHLRAEMGRGAGDITQIVPEVRERLPDLPDLPLLEPAQDRFRLFDSITSFLLNLAQRRPLVLILEDLHWADKPSLLLLEFLAREMHAAPLLVIGSYRDLEVSQSHPLTQMLVELIREPISERIVLRGLSEADVARFIELTTGVQPAATLATAIAQETEGNPFFISELVRLLLAEGRLDRATDTTALSLMLPESVREVIRRRLDRLSQGCQRVLRTAAVIGRDFRLASLQRIDPSGADVLLEVLEEASTVQVITQAPGGIGHYRFVHALIRETLYEELGPAARVRLHRRVGEAMEALYRAEPEQHLAELAHHFFQAAPGGGVDKAVSYAVRAAERAARLSAHEEAVRCYGLAIDALELQEPPSAGERYELLLALGDAQRRAGNIPEAKEAFRRTAEAARVLEAPEYLARGALGYAEYPDLKGGDAQVRLLEEALGMLPAEDSALRARLLGLLAENLVFLRAHRRSVALAEQAVAMARRTGDLDTLAYVLNEEQWALWGQGKVDKRLASASELVQLAVEVRDRDLLQNGRRWRIIALLELGDVRRADTEIEAFAHLAEELQQPLGILRSLQLRAMRALLDGRFADGEQLAREALAVGQRERSQRAAQGFLSQMMLLRWEQGRLGELEAEIKEFAARQPLLPFWRCALALAYVEQGRAVEALSEFEALAEDDFTALAQEWDQRVSVAIVSQVCAALGDSQRAAALYTLLLPYADQNIVSAGALTCRGSASYYLGLLASTMGHWEDAERHFEAAIGMNRSTGARPFLARTHYHYAAMLLRARTAGRGARTVQDTRSQARKLLEDAMAIAHELGMARLVEQIEGLRLTPDPSRRSVSSVSNEAGPERLAPLPGGLTTREIEVVRWIAAGKSNRAIAAELVVSIRTVDHHIANIYRKLGVSGRAEATAYAMRHGLGPPAPSAE